MGKDNEHKESARLSSDPRIHEVSQENCFPQLFAAQVKRTPDAVAAVCEGESLTYQELYQRVCLLARSLRTLGVGPESLVALLAERSLSFLTSVLAIWQAGGAYLPLDPHHPPARIRQVLAHSGSCQRQVNSGSS